MKKVSILGSTGSVGKATLEVIRRYPGRFRVVGLATGKNIHLLKEQIEEFRPSVVAVADTEGAERLRREVSGVKVLSGHEGLNEVATHPEVDMVISAISGSAGLIPTYEAIRASKAIGLANKETLVMAGNLVMSEVKRRGVLLIPVDSEHSALFQCLENRDRSTVRRLILTASGGPFRELPEERMRCVTVTEALNHPIWKMGKKITIDSATLMNKALEVIEAHFLFDFPAESIEVVIHPESVVHSLIELADGSLIAHLSVPDMKGPIAYALSYPERLSDVLPGCKLTELRRLSFERPDLQRFPCLGYAYTALRMGGTATTVLNAANEMAVEAFLQGVISFMDIPVIIEEILSAHSPKAIQTLDDVFDADRWARQRFEEVLQRH